MVEIDTPNFGRIKDAYNSILAEGILTKDAGKKKTFRKYVKTIKENEILKTQFLIYTNLENKVETDIHKATMFVNENIKLLSKFKKEDIFNANKSFLIEGVEFKDIGGVLYEAISTLIFTDRKPETIDHIVEATDNVVKHILNNKLKIVTEAIDLPNSMLSKLMVEKYNERYADLDDTEKQIIKVLFESTNEEKKTVYTNAIRECIDLIDEKLNTSDLEAKDKLLRVKDKLLNDKQEINEDFIKNISKLVELRSSLKESK